MPRSAPMNPMQVDAEIVRLSSLLEERVEEFAHISREAALAEAAYKSGAAHALIDVIAETRGERTTVKEREALAEVRVEDKHEAFLVSQAAAKSTRESLGALRVQIDALRTIAANHRALAGPS